MSSRITAFVIVLVACAPRVDSPAASSDDGPRCVEHDGDPPPGQPGGLCLAPDGHCDGDAVCNRDENYCLLEDDPCHGFACGGSDAGCCLVVDGQPSCMCNAGFDNESYALYCCPDDGSDPLCPR